MTYCKHGLFLITCEFCKKEQTEKENLKHQLTIQTLVLNKETGETLVSLETNSFESHYEELGKIERSIEELKHCPNCGYCNKTECDNCSWCGTAKEEE